MSNSTINYDTIHDKTLYGSVLYVGVPSNAVDSLKNLIVKGDVILSIIDADSVKTTHLADFIDINTVESTENHHTVSNITVQECIDTYESINTVSTYDVIYLNGIFNKYLYGDKQYDFMFVLIEKCLKLSMKKVAFTLDMCDSGDESWKYNIIYIITYLINTYNDVEIHKLSNDVFTCIITKG